MGEGEALATIRAGLEEVRRELHAFNNTLAQVKSNQDDVDDWRQALNRRWSWILGLGAGSSAVFALLGGVCGTYIWFDVQRRYAMMDAMQIHQNAMSEDIKLLRAEVGQLKGTK
jgi:hypothetical protein